MRASSSVAFILAILCLPCFLGAQQAPATATPATTQSATSLAAPSPTSSAEAATAPASSPNPPAPTASGLLQPALDSVQETVAAVKLEKWKKGTVREEAGDNIKGILKDLQTTLPPLLKSADAAPGALTGLLPVSRNINALYNVLLRVEEAARVAAPGDQADELQQALVKLGDARRAIDDRIEEAALAQEKQVADLRSTVKAQADIKCPAVPAPAAPKCPAPAPAKTKRKPTSSTTKSTTANPSTTPPTSTSGTGK